MMNHFVVRYIPGGMSLDYSAWWLCESKIIDGVWCEWKIKKLRNVDYF